MKKPEKRILLFIKVPPPITGATLMNKYVLDSKLLKENFIIRSVQISYSKSVGNLGKFSLHKFIIFTKIFFTLLIECIFNRPQFIYFQISPLGLAFFRDLIYVSLIKLFNIRIVYHLHGKGIKKKVEKKYLALLYKYAFLNSEVICLSNILTFDIKDVFNGKIHIVNNGIPDMFKEIRLTHQNDSVQKKISILFLSNLIKSKGILDFVEALKILADKHIDFEANIVGAESDIKASYLIDLLTRYKLSDKVFYLGPKYNSEKMQLLANSDVLIFPTFYENETFGLVLIEAMQFGVPCITCAEGMISEIVTNGYNGFIVEKNNPQKIAEKIQIFIINPDLIKTMGAAGRKKYLEKYTLEIFESNMKNVFDKVLKKCNANR